MALGFSKSQETYTQPRNNRTSENVSIIRFTEGVALGRKRGVGLFLLAGTSLLRTITQKLYRAHALFRILRVGGSFS